MPTFSLRRAAWLALLTSAIALAACNQPDAPPDQAKAAPPAKGKAASSQEAGEKENAEKESNEAGEAGLLRLSAEEIETAGIQVEDLEMKPVADQVVLTATIRANQDRIAHVAPRVSARVAKSVANLGDSVKVGQALAVLDSLELGEAHSAYRQAQSQFALAKADFERAEKLKVDEIIPEKDYLRARSEYEKARAAWRAADDRLRLLDGEHRDSDQGPTSLFPLRAPFAGTVIEKRAVVGELAQPDKSLFTVADLSTLWIEANLFEKDLSRVRLGARAIVTVSAYPEETFQGRLTYISSTVDKETRAVPARVEVPNPDRRLKPEMFATAAIATGGATSAITLPQSAVLLVNGQPMAFVREEGGFEPRAVELGEKVGTSQRQQQHGHQASGGKGPKYLFSGLLRCGCCGGAYIVVDRYRYGCATNKDRGDAACANTLKVPRKVVEQVLLAGIKAELLSEAAYKAFEEEARRLLKEAQPDPSEAKRMAAKAKAEIDNIMTAIRAGIITHSTKVALEEAEARLQEAERQVLEIQRFQPAQILPRAREIHRSMVEQLERIEDVSAAREAIRAIVGEIRLIPEDGELWAEMNQGGMAALSQLSVVAGARSERYLTPFRVKLSGPNSRAGPNIAPIGRVRQLVPLKVSA